MACSKTVNEDQRPGTPFKQTGANVIARIEKNFNLFSCGKKDKNKEERFDLEDD